MSSANRLATADGRKKTTKAFYIFTKKRVDFNSENGAKNPFGQCKVILPEPALPEVKIAASELTFLARKTKKVVRKSLTETDHQKL